MIKRGTETDVFSVGKEVDGIQSHQKLHHVDKFSACPCCVLLFYPLDRRTNHDRAKIKLNKLDGLHI